MGDVTANTAPGAVVRATIARCAVAFVACVAAFFVLLAGAFSLPAGLLEQNVARSADVLVSEGDVHYLFGGRGDWLVDVYTTAIMLNTASVNYDDPLEGFAYDYRWAKTDATQGESLADSLGRRLGEGAGGEWISYSRYWHGYVTILRPLLLVTDVNGIRTIFIVAFSLLLLVASWLLARMTNPAAGLLYALCFVVVHWFVALASLPFAFGFLIAVGGTLFVELHQKGAWSLEGDASRCVPRWATFYLVLGALIAYLDFLDNPIITFGVPAAVLLYLNKDLVTRQTCGRCVCLLLVFGVCWALGYGLAWGAKWVLSSVVAGEDLVTQALSTVTYRSGSMVSAAEGGMTISRTDAVLRNVGVLAPHGGVVLLGALLVIGAYVVAARRRGVRLAAWWLVPAAMLFLVPYLWFYVVSNHSFLHYWFTYRDQLVSLVVAALVAAEGAYKLRAARAAKDSPGIVRDGSVSQGAHAVRGR